MRSAAASKPSLHHIAYGEQSFPVLLSFDRFQTLRISIRRDGTISVRVPHGTSLEYITACVQGKAPWILRHVERFRSRQTLPLQYLSGETHSYLGRRYPLQVHQGQRNSAGLIAGVFEVTTRTPPRPEQVQKLLEAWYLREARPVFERLIHELLPRFEIYRIARPTRLVIRAMTSRWGSCSSSGTITLNRHLIKAPLECVEYVVAHELCHLKHRGHGARFYGLLAAIIPDWRERKKRLRDAVVLQG